VEDDRTDDGDAGGVDRGAVARNGLRRRRCGRRHVRREELAVVVEEKRGNDVRLRPERAEDRASGFAIIEDERRNGVLANDAAQRFEIGEELLLESLAV